MALVTCPIKQMETREKIPTPRCRPYHVKLRIPVIHKLYPKSLYMPLFLFLGMWEEKHPILPPLKKQTTHSGNLVDTFEPTKDVLQQQLDFSTLTDKITGGDYLTSHL